MLIKSRGIVLHHIKHTDSSLVVHIYTEFNGRQAFFIISLRGKKSRFPVGLLQPLFIVEMEVYYKANREMQHLKEIRPYLVFQSVPFDVKKSTIALFLGEILYKTLKEQEPNPGLFEFLVHTIQLLDLSPQVTGSFHLLFLLHLSRYLGFFPDNNYSENKPYFDLMNGHFVPFQPPHPHYLDRGKSRDMNHLLCSPLNGMNTIRFQPAQREALLEQILEYYQLHMDGLGEIKSWQVLREVFH